MAKLDLLTANDRLGEYPKSFYASDKEALARPALEADISADVCIIGAGFTGLGAALALAKAGHSVVVLEASRVGFGASGRNGGQIGTGQREGQDVLEKQYGRDVAKQLFDIGVRAHDHVAELCAEHSIDIHYQRGIAHAEFDAAGTRHSHEYAEKLAREYGYDKIECLDAKTMRARVNSPKYQGGVIDWGGGHGDPLALALGMAKAAESYGAKLYENSKVTVLDDKATTARGSVKAEHYIVACNGYLGELDAEIGRYVMPINNFIVATEPLGIQRAMDLIPQNIAVADSKFVVNYFRLSHDHRLLFGGGESYGYQFPKDLAAKARGPMVDIFPQLQGVKVDYAWGGTLAITRNRMPYVRRRRNHWTASGYSGHGVAMASFCGDLIGRAIGADVPEFDVMASLKHKAFPGGAPLRQPLLIGAMLWFQLRDKLGV